MKVNKVIYVIVALFLGGLGIHKFYADKFGQGLFHLLFFWTGIPTIISIIHAIFIIFTKKADKDDYIIFPKN
ncbi:TPA: NINE protein [Staphylococcus aureus]|nr:NINE protein [Staphylococcus aureus]HDA0964361.1 NINE protein [Staphylococcus aureus]HDA3035416.1 NINE protein [Staphylococcus aureus]